MPLTELSLIVIVAVTPEFPMTLTIVVAPGFLSFGELLQLAGGSRVRREQFPQPLLHVLGGTPLVLVLEVLQFFGVFRFGAEELLDACPHLFGELDGPIARLLTRLFGDLLVDGVDAILDVGQQEVRHDCGKDFNHGSCIHQWWVSWQDAMRNDFAIADDFGQLLLLAEVLRRPRGVSWRCTLRCLGRHALVQRLEPGVSGDGNGEGRHCGRSAGHGRESPGACTACSGASTAAAAAT